MGADATAAEGRKEGRCRLSRFRAELGRDSKLCSLPPPPHDTEALTSGGQDLEATGKPGQGPGHQDTRAHTPDPFIRNQRHLRGHRLRFPVK